MGRTRVTVSSPATYSAVTSDPNGDEVLYVFEWGEGSAETTELLPSGDTAQATHKWTDTGEYTVRARAQDANGNWSGWSEALAVTVTVNHPPGPPTRPTHIGVDSVGMPIGFTTSAIDEDGDSVRIKYYFAEGQVSGYGPPRASGEAYTDTVIYSQNGWKVVYAVAADGTDTSDWSLPDSIYIKSPNVPPYAPEIRAQYTPQRGIASGPKYRFYASARDQYGDSVYYRWYFDESDSVTSQIFPSGVDGYAEWTPTLDTHSYTVTVRAFDQTGLTNPTTPTTVFRTVAEGEVIWGLAGEFIASPAIGPSIWRGDTRAGVICGSTDGYMYVVDAYQSFAISQTPVLDFDPYNSSPTIGADGTRFVGNENGWFYAISTDDSTRWQFGGTFGMTATAALGADGSIFCGGEDQSIHKLTDAGNRANEAWSYPLRQDLSSSPAIGPDGTVYCCDYDGYVYALNSDRTLRWEIRVADSFGITSSPATAADGTVYVGTEDGRLLALKDGSILWSYQVEAFPVRGISSSPVIGADGSIFFTCDDGNLYRIDQDTHQPVAGWPVEVSDRVLDNTPLLCADDIIYVADDSSLYAYYVNGPGSGPRWRTTLALPGGKPGGGRLSIDLQPSPVVDQYGIIYTATGYGIFAVAGRPGGTLAATDWPMFHHDPRHTGRFGAGRLAP